MIEKKEKFIFKKVLVLTGLVFFLNIIYLIYRIGIYPRITGNSIGSSFSEIYSAMPISSKIFLIVQWVFLIALLVYSLFRDRGMKDKTAELKGIDLAKMSQNSKTDLDTLYNVLKDKKKLRLSTISKLFSVKKGTAIEWCKILEADDLVAIDFPAIGEPIIRLVE